MADSCQISYSKCLYELRSSGAPFKTNIGALCTVLMEEPLLILQFQTMEPNLASLGEFNNFFLMAVVKHLRNAPFHTESNMMKKSAG